MYFEVTDNISAEIVAKIYDYHFTKSHGENLGNFKKFSRKGKLFRVNIKTREMQHFIAGIAKTKFAAI
jgi:hypothetical protein